MLLPASMTTDHSEMMALLMERLKKVIGAFQGGRTRFETYQCVRIARLPFD